ncbi:MAG TPA: RagB/SusD family nutrient uptake outer membrane protein [Chitinophagaceae bacterium]|nr:RagB/SusD family nutrient uptake outer membrane protein [Chitinophagaceae bacterium]
MKLINKSIKILAVAIPLLATEACTKLDENVYSEIVTDEYYNNKTEVLSAVLRPYTHTNAWITSSGQVGYWRVNELAGDQLAWPVKGIHGQDNGNWIRLHYHTWTVDDDIVWNPWSLLYTGVGFCNSPIENLEKRDIQSMGITQTEKDAYIADLKLQRAFYYLKLMDLYGNIPVATVVGEVSPPTMPRAEVFKFIEKEIKDNIDKAPNLAPSLIGRLTKAGAYAMLAELYLNAEKWTGTPRWDDCIAACDQLIQAKAGSQTTSPMALDANINTTFSNNNHLSREIIFSIAYDFQKSTFRANFNSDFYHFNQRFIYDGSFNGNDGVVVIPGVYSKYSDKDQRKKDWFLIGPQFYQAEPNRPVLGAFEYNGQPLVFVDNIRKNKTGGTESNMSVGEENSGVRFNKYKPGRASDAAYFSNDWAVYRLTWIYFAKAEAIMRKNGGVANTEAVQLINDCKKRAFSAADWATEAYTVSTLTLDELLEERGREFIFEGVRRTDLVRFNKFVSTPWWDHTPSNDKNKELFPIPFRQVAANPNLKQNPGY